MATWPAHAQEPAQPAWLVSKFDITVTLNQEARTMTTRAVLSVRNVGRGSGSRLTVRLNSAAEVKAVTVNDITAGFRVSPEIRGANLQRAEVTLPATVAPNGAMEVTFDYTLPVAKNEGVAALSPLGNQFLPASSWYPVPNMIYAPRGTDIAPWRVTVNGLATGETLLAAGKPTANSADNPLYGQPFLVTGSWDKVDIANASAYLAKGAETTAQARAKELLELASAARSFYATLLGTGVDAPLRIVEVSRGGGFSGSGTLLLNPPAFRGPKLDANTALQVAEGVAQLWTEGNAPLRGEGAGALRSGFTRYLALLFLDKQFGKEVSEAEWRRGRAAHRRSVANEAALALTTPLDSTYYTSTALKGAMVWRLAERLLGLDGFMGVMREQYAQAAGNFNGLTLAQVRDALNRRGGETVQQILDQQFTEATTLDLQAGVPVQQGANWAVNLRNTAAFPVTVSVVAYTDKGERLTTDITIPARDFGAAGFTTPNKLIRAEVDPAKIYPQTDYSNDFAPRGKPPEDAQLEVAALYNRLEYANTEKTARELLALTPSLSEVRIYLARALMAQNRDAEAEKEFRAAFDEKLPTAWTQAWASLGLGDIAARRNQTEAALRHYTNAINADAEYAATLLARNARVRLAPNAPVDESAKAFIAQLDAAIKGGRKQELDALVVSGELVDFTKGVVGSQPEIWQTQVLHSEARDANRIVLDVALTTKSLGKEQSGTAVYTLAKLGGAWRLARIELFEVR